MTSLIFITEEDADKANAQYPTCHYYAVGLNIGGVDYTVKLTIGVDENGNRFYEHSLTEIEKGRLLDIIGTSSVPNTKESVSGFISTGAEPNPSVTVGKDTKLQFILQNNSSKVVGEKRKVSDSELWR